MSDTHTDEPIATDIIVYRDSPYRDMGPRGIDWDRETQDQLWREVDKATQTGVKVVTWKSCMECGELTKGSRGAAGLFWACLCQPCKDEADGLVSGIVAHQGVMARALDSVVLGVPFA